MILKTPHISNNRIAILLNLSKLFARQESSLTKLQAQRSELASKRSNRLFAKLAGTAEYRDNLPLVHTSYCAVYSLFDAEGNQGFKVFAKLVTAEHIQDLDLAGESVAASDGGELLLPE